MNTDGNPAFPPGMLQACLVSMFNIAQGRPGEQTEPPWVTPALSAMSRLDWNAADLPDERQPPRIQAAAGLLAVMAMALPANTPPPTSIIPTSQGGCVAEWHINGMDLELEFLEGHAPSYFFQSGPGMPEYEADVDQDFENLRQHAALLPHHEG